MCECRCYEYLQLQVSAPHHSHVLLLAQRGVPHGQLVVLVFDSQQLVAVGVPLLSQLVVPWRTSSVSDYMRPCDERVSLSCIFIVCLLFLLLFGPGAAMSGERSGALVFLPLLQLPTTVQRHPCEAN